MEIREVTSSTRVYTGWWMFKEWDNVWGQQLSRHVSRSVSPARPSVPRWCVSCVVPHIGGRLNASVSAGQSALALCWRCWRQMGEQQVARHPSAHGVHFIRYSCSKQGNAGLRPNTNRFEYKNNLSHEKCNKKTHKTRNSEETFNISKTEIKI